MSMPPAYHESLPYIDKEPSEQSLAAARALISAEVTASSEKPTTALPPSAGDSLKLSQALETELLRISSSTPLTPLDLSRYEAQEPPATTSSPADLLPPFTNSCISSTYLASRAQNLRLLDKHGKNAWLLGNNELEAELKRLEAELTATKAEVDRVNLERRRRQEEARGEMEILEEGWKKGIGRVLETEVAVQELRAKIREELRNAALP